VSYRYCTQNVSEQPFSPNTNFRDISALVGDRALTWIIVQMVDRSDRSNTLIKRSLNDIQRWYRRSTAPVDDQSSHFSVSNWQDLPTSLARRRPGMARL